jgi:hypothetical protein
MALLDPPRRLPAGPRLRLLVRRRLALGPAHPADRLLGRGLPATTRSRCRRPAPTFRRAQPRRDRPALVGDRAYPAQLVRVPAQVQACRRVPVLRVRVRARCHRAPAQEARVPVLPVQAARVPAPAPSRRVRRAVPVAAVVAPAVPVPAQAAAEVRDRRPVASAPVVAVAAAVVVPVAVPQAAVAAAVVVPVVAAAAVVAVRSVAAVAVPAVAVVVVPSAVPSVAPAHHVASSASPSVRSARNSTT